MTIDPKAGGLAARPPVHYELLIIGSGIAGLVAALTAAGQGRVAVLCKDRLASGSSLWAQGGIAAAIGPDDSPALHFADTIAAGRELCDPDAVRVLVDEAPARIDDLIEWGVRFDTAGKSLALSQEAGHSRRRIVHAADATGAAVCEALVGRLASTNTVILEQHTLLDLVVVDGCCIGADVVDGDGTLLRISADAVILASGGAGSLWRHTTNPAGVDGQGMVAAHDAGATLASLEFVQFHPTALALKGAPHFLISEAVRGEGAHLVNDRGERFCLKADPRGELAPRDVVASAIWEEMAGAGANNVWLDCTPIGASVSERFPTITERCAHWGLDINHDPIPVAPAAHYFIGGVVTDLQGATAVPGLFACGEVAHTGVHGANRLASNSLLEGAVFGRRAARAALSSVPESQARSQSSPPHVEATAAADLPTNRAAIADALWQGAGLVRDQDGLQRASDVLTQVEANCAGDRSPAARLLSASARLATFTCRSALLRAESRGAHVRSDFTSSRSEYRGLVTTSREKGTSFDRHA